LSSALSITERLDTIVVDLEVSMTDMRYTANQPLSEKDKEKQYKPIQLLDSKILRNHIRNTK
jgi:hypothetical protein